MRLPHGFPFRLVDRRAGERARVLLSANDFWSRGSEARGLALWVEAMAQAAALLLQQPGEEPGGELSLAGIEGARLERLPRPGDEVTIEVCLEARFGKVTRVAARIADGRGDVARATLLLARGGSAGAG